MTINITATPLVRLATLDEMIAVGRYEHIRRGITEEKFPVKPELFNADGLVVVSLVKDMTDAEVGEEIDSRGLVDVTIEALLAYGEKNPSEPLLEQYVVARASLWTDSDPESEQRGSEWVPYLNRVDDGRWLSLGWLGAIDRWDHRKFTFLARPK
jgi:hypothetical protein